MSAEELLSKIPRHNMNIQKIVMARDANVDDAPFKPRTMMEITDVYEKEKVLWVMEEYAKQIAIGFKEWGDENLEGGQWEQYDGHDTWIKPITHEVFSTQQLFDLYLSQTNQKA